MNKYKISKDEIDEKNPLIKDTFFGIAKNSRVGSGNNTIDLDSDDFVTYQLISRNYDLKSSLDRCIVDKDKMKVINSIKMYNLGENYDVLFKSLMNNKYCNIYLETVLKDNPFTKNIINYLCDIDSSNIGSYIDSDGNDLITWVCKNEDTFSILQIINKFGEKVLPKKIDKLLNLVLERDLYDVYIKLIDNFGDKINLDYVNSDGNTLLMNAYANFSGDIASKLIDKFGELCKPDFVNKDGYTALIMGCQNAPEYEVFEILKFGEKCKPEQVNINGQTALIAACSKTSFKMASYLIDTFGEKCKPDQVDNYGGTALIYICQNSFYRINDVALKLIDTFGKKCKPDQVDSDGNTALHHAINQRENDIAIKLIDTFGMKCNPEQVNKDGKTALDCAIKNKMDDVVSKLKTLLDD
jgi:ankyrin repeat protein